MNTKIDELFATLRVLIAAADFDLATAMAELANVAKERDKLNTELSDACRKINSLSIALDTKRITAQHAKAESGTARQNHRDAVAGWKKAALERDNARQSLRAAEADAAETDSVNADLRTVNARLVADLAAAVQRAATAEELFACAGLRGRY
jgi:chromosome segregation ATPase